MSTCNAHFSSDVLIYAQIQHSLARSGCCAWCRDSAPLTPGFDPHIGDGRLGLPPSQPRAPPCVHAMHYEHAAASAAVLLVAMGYAAPRGTSYVRDTAASSAEPAVCDPASSPTEAATKLYVTLPWICRETGKGRKRLSTRRGRSLGWDDDPPQVAACELREHFPATFTRYVYSITAAGRPNR